MGNVTPDSSVSRLGSSSVEEKLMHSWGFALREGVFAETKEGKCKNKREKS